VRDGYIPGCETTSQERDRGKMAARHRDLSLITGALGAIVQTLRGWCHPNQGWLLWDYQSLVRRSVGDSCGRSFTTRWSGRGPLLPVILQREPYSYLRKRKEPEVHKTFSSSRPRGRSRAVIQLASVMASAAKFFVLPFTRPAGVRRASCSVRFVVWLLFASALLGFAFPGPPLLNLAGFDRWSGTTGARS